MTPRRRFLVSIPFIAGQWSLLDPERARRLEHQLVSIPFIAGQWSLRGSAPTSRKREASFNPLHCGAVVASQGAGRDLRQGGRGVSIPFIAGQWSLQEGGREEGGRKVGFQSPSLRGSGRFSRPAPCGADRLEKFQSPSLRGSGRFARAGRARRGGHDVSIPFIAGQWSLPARASADVAEARAGFNPLQCGAVVASLRRYGMLFQRFRVSIPFIAGQWSLRSACGTPPSTPNGFNPLHCGAVVASRIRHPPVAGFPRVSIPFIAGQWSLQEDDTLNIFVIGEFQSPSLRGSGRFLDRGACVSVICVRFQSPSLRGSGRFYEVLERSLETQSSFNPLHCGAVVASDGAPSNPAGRA